LNRTQNKQKHTRMKKSNKSRKQKTKLKQ